MAYVNAYTNSSNSHSGQYHQQTIHNQKERQETRNKTIQWQTMSKDKKIQEFQQTPDQSHLAAKSSKLDMDEQSKSLTDWYIHNNSIGPADMSATAA